MTIKRKTDGLRRDVLMRSWDVTRGCSTLAKLLDCYMRTGPQSAHVPGIGRFSLAAAAEHLEVDLRTLRRALTELESRVVCKFDGDAGVLFVPFACTERAPLTECYVKSWASPLKDVPGSALRAQWLQTQADLLATKPAEFLNTLRAIAGVHPPVDAPVHATSTPPSTPSQSLVSGPLSLIPGEGEAPAPSPPTPAPVAERSDDPALDAAVAVLEDARDLWPNESVVAIAAAARRIIRDVLAEPCAKRDGVDPQVALREALPRVRAWATGKSTSEAQRLAQTHVVVGWILGDCRAGKRRKVEPKPADKVVGTELDEVKQRQRRLDREEQEKAEAARRRDAVPPSQAATLIGDALANLGKPRAAAGGQR